MKTRHQPYMHHLLGACGEPSIPHGVHRPKSTGICGRALGPARKAHHNGEGVMTMSALVTCEECNATIRLRDNLRYCPECGACLREEPDVESDDDSDEEDDQ